MMKVGNKLFRRVYCVDFEFSQPEGERPLPVCMVAVEVVTGEQHRLTLAELQSMPLPPWEEGDDVLLVAFYAAAEVSCMLELGWPVPTNILDLYFEFRCEINGGSVIAGVSLLGALLYYGLDSIAGDRKIDMRELAMRGPPYTDAESSQLLEYCSSDVDAVVRLLERMATNIDIKRALVRGEYAGAVAVMERQGIPLDVPTLMLLKSNVDSLKKKLINKTDCMYGVFENGVFKQKLFAQYVIRQNIPWPRSVSGRLKLDDNTFKSMTQAFPELNDLLEIRRTLATLTKIKLAVGSDGHNRCMLSPFQARTGRNQPSTTRFIFGLSVWWRFLIKPPPGYAIAYVDWSQQEFGIAAALSGDGLMQNAYLSGDPYLAFAKQAGAAPQHATKTTHKMIRDQFKATTLAVQYGMGEDSLALRINQPVARARELLRLHRSTYRKFWAWSDASLDYAMLNGFLETVLGWKVNVPTHPNPRSLRNFPMQANGAEMLRLACCELIDEGIKVARRYTTLY